MRRATWLLIVVCSAACGEGAKDKRPPIEQEQPDSKEADVRVCVGRFEGLVGASPGSVMRLLPRFCRAECPVEEDKYGYVAYLEFAKGCGLFCSDEARARYDAAAEPDRWRVLVDECGAAYYGLPRDYPEVLDEHWFLLHRLGRWLHLARPGLSAALTERLDRVLAQLSFDVNARAFVPAGMSLPLQATTRQRLSFLVWVVDDGVLAGAMPHGVVTPGGTLELEYVSGGEMTPVGVDELAEHLGALRDRMPDRLLSDRNTPQVLVMADADAPASKVLDVFAHLGEMTGRLALRDRTTGEVGPARLSVRTRPYDGEAKLIPIDVQVAPGGYVVKRRDRARAKPHRVTFGSSAELSRTVTGLLPDGAKALLWFGADPHATVGLVAEAFDVIGDVRDPAEPDGWRRRWHRVLVAP